MRERLGLDAIILVLQQNRLRWYGHMLQKEDSDWVTKCVVCSGGCWAGRKTGKTWTEVVQGDCLACELNRKNAMDRSRWRKPIKDD